MKKKVLGVFLSMMMACSLVACGGSPDNADSADAQSNSNTKSSVDSADAQSGSGTESGVDSADDKAVANEKSYKIGFTYWSSTDPLGARMVKTLEKCCSATGCELVYIDQLGYDADGFLDTYQQLIEMGCDGLICSYLSPAILELCEEKGVEMVLGNAGIGDDSMKELIKDSAVFAGSVREADYNAGMDMGQAFKNAGCTKIAYAGPAQGMSPCSDDRYLGLQDFVAENSDMEIVTEYRGDETDPVVQMLTTYPEIDGLMVATTDSLEAVEAAGKLEGLKVVTGNILDTDYYVEDGTIIWGAGQGGSAQNLDNAFIVLYNALTGHEIIEDKTEEIEIPMISFTNYEEYEENVAAVEGDIPIYTEDEIRGMCMELNPDIAMEEIVKKMESRSLDEILERHADLL